MMKLLNLVSSGSVFVLLCVGCQPPPMPPQAPPPPSLPPPAAPPIIVAPYYEPPPPIPPEPPPVPPVASIAFMNGYNDGYYGTWLGPVRWVIRNEYRAGWSLGTYERRHRLPHRYHR